MDDRDRERIERCLAVVAEYEATGHKAADWAAANGISIGNLASWCAHAGRWRARLGLQGPPNREVQASAHFVRAALPAASKAATVRVEWPVAGGTATLHWPMSHVGELGRWLREVAR